MIYLVLAFILLYFFLAKKRLDWAVMLMLAALPTYLIRFKVLGIPFTLLEAMILISFVVWFVWHTEFWNFVRGKYGWQKFKENRRKRIKYPFSWEIILLLIVSYGAVAVAGFSDSALGVWKAYFFEPVLVFILVLNVFKHNANDANEMRMMRVGLNIKKVLWPLTISALVISVFAIYQKFTGYLIPNELWAAEETRRVTSFFGYPNAVGLYLGPLVMVMVGWLFYNAKCLPDSASQWQAGKMQNAKLFIVFTTLVLSLLAIYFAKSEGALIAVTVGLVVFGLLGGRKMRWATAAMVVVIGSMIMAYQPARDYAQNKITLNDLSGQIRRQQWQETWQMLQDERMIIGSGLANYQLAIAPYHQEGIFFNKDNDPEFHRHVVWNEEYKKSHWQPVEIYMYPHNILLNFWTELGLIGMLLFIWIIFKFMLVGAKIIRNQKLEIARPSRLGGIGEAGGNLDSKNDKFLVLGLMGAMVVIIVHGMVDVPYFKNDLAVIFWVFIAVMSLLNLELRSKKLENG